MSSAYTGTGNDVVKSLYLEMFKKQLDMAQSAVA